MRERERACVPASAKLAENRYGGLSRRRRDFETDAPMLLLLLNVSCCVFLLCLTFFLIPGKTQKKESSVDQSLELEIGCLG